jgi:hypothetical protein
MDLAKICYYKNTSQDDSFLHNGAQLILNPSTLGAVLTATAKDCLSLCTEEEALLSYYCPKSMPEGTESFTVLVDEKSIAVPMWISSDRAKYTTSQRVNFGNATIFDCVFASLVIALDAAHSMDECFSHNAGTTVDESFRKSLEECVTSATKCLEVMKLVAPFDDPTQIKAAILESKCHAISTMMHAGKLLSFGDASSMERRNISIALSSSLLPTYFPHGNWLTFTACLLPGICHTLGSYHGMDTDVENQLLRRTIAGIVGRDESIATVKMSHLLEWVDEITNGSACIPIPALTKLAQGAPDTSELLNKIDENCALLNCKDASSSYLESILISSLDR